MDGDGARDQASATKRDSATRHFNYSSCAPSIQTSTQRSLYPLEWAQTSVLEMRSPISQSLVVGRPTDTFRNLHEGNLIDSLDLDILLMIFDLVCVQLNVSSIGHMANIGDSFWKTIPRFLTAKFFLRPYA
jgi:hypothetical protein